MSGRLEQLEHKEMDRVPEPLTASEREVSAILRRYFHKCSLDCANQIVGE